MTKLVNRGGFEVRLAGANERHAFVIVGTTAGGKRYLQLQRLDEELEFELDDDKLMSIASSLFSSPGSRARVRKWMQMYERAERNVKRRR